MIKAFVLKVVFIFRILRERVLTRLSLFDVPFFSTSAFYILYFFGGIVYVESSKLNNYFVLVYLREMSLLAILVVSVFAS